MWTEGRVELLKLLSRAPFRHRPSTLHLEGEEVRPTVKPKRAMPVVKTALDKARVQLVLAQKVATLSGEPQIAATIETAKNSLDGVTAAMRDNRCAH